MRNFGQNFSDFLPSLLTDIMIFERSWIKVFNILRQNESLYCVNSTFRQNFSGENFYSIFYFGKFALAEILEATAFIKHEIITDLKLGLKNCILADSKRIFHFWYTIKIESLSVKIWSWLGYLLLLASGSRIKLSHLLTVWDKHFLLFTLTLVFHALIFIKSKVWYRSHCFWRWHFCGKILPTRFSLKYLNTKKTWWCMYFLILLLQCN